MAEVFSLNTINARMASSAAALIIVSRPVDPDCIGTARALRWLLAAQGRTASIICFFSIPSNMTGFPGMDEIIVAQPGSFDFSPFDLFITVDGSSWGQFFGDEWQHILGRLDMARIINIDHHEAEEIMLAIPGQCLNSTTSSTAQVLYEHFIEPSGLTPPAGIADCLYRALLYDTRGFRNEMHTGAYRFAEALIGLGADHARAVDVNYDMREVQYLTWAIEHTEFISDLGLMLLVIDAGRLAELEALLGKDFLDFDTIYKETIQRQIEGFHYGIILTDKLDGSVRLTWRTRGYGSHLAIADVARAAGFRAGGHRNAGGGIFKGSIQDAQARLLELLREKVLK
jgi:nanoRNase/pAp phosphatase (c-di-AMP/oligoRNAs hydrolase)